MASSDVATRDDEVIFRDGVLNGELRRLRIHRRHPSADGVGTAICRACSAAPAHFDEGDSSVTDGTCCGSECMGGAAFRYPTNASTPANSAPASAMITTNQVGVRFLLALNSYLPSRSLNLFSD